jgi:hypothetical protein
MGVFASALLHVDSVAIRDTTVLVADGVATTGCSVCCPFAFVARFDEGTCYLSTEWNLLNCDHQHRAHCLLPLTTFTWQTSVDQTAPPWLYIRHVDRDCNDNRNNARNPEPV